MELHQLVELAQTRNSWWQTVFSVLDTTATKFLCVKTVSDKVVRHSFAYLSVHK